MSSLLCNAAKKFSQFFPLIIALALLVGCGGGGGGGDGDSVTFSGSITPAEVNSGNIVDFSEGIAGGVELPFLFSLGSASASLAPVASVTAHLAVSVLPADHFDGSCGGTLDISYDSSSLTEITASAVAVNYCEDGTISSNIPTDGDIVNGRFTISIGKSASSSWENVTFSSFSSRDRTDDYILELDGSANMIMPVGGDPYLLENMIVTLVEDGVTSEYWLEDFRLQSDSTGMAWTATGQVYYGNEGFVWLETTDPLVPLSPSDLEEGLVAGTVEIHGESTDGRLIFGIDPEYTLELRIGTEWTPAGCYDEDWSSTACSP